MLSIKDGKVDICWKGVHRVDKNLQWIPTVGSACRSQQTYRQECTGGYIDIVSVLTSSVPGDRKKSEKGEKVVWLRKLVFYLLFEGAIFEFFSGYQFSVTFLELFYWSASFYPKWYGSLSSPDKCAIKWHFKTVFLIYDGIYVLAFSEDFSKSKRKHCFRSTCRGESFAKFWS